MIDPYFFFNKSFEQNFIFFFPAAEVRVSYRTAVLGLLGILCFAQQRLCSITPKINIMKS